MGCTSSTSLQRLCSRVHYTNQPTGELTCQGAAAGFSPARSSPVAPTTDRPLCPLSHARRALLSICRLLMRALNTLLQPRKRGALSSSQNAAACKAASTAPMVCKTLGSPVHIHVLT